MSNQATTTEETDSSSETIIAQLWSWTASSNRYQLAVLVLSLLALLTAPLWGDTILFTLALANIYAIFAMSWDIISGHTDYISFGHSFLSGFAAYTTALLLYNVDPNMSIYITFPLSVVVALAAGMVFALPSLRLRGPYFSLLTFVAVLIASKLVYILSEYTNGELGIAGVPVLSYSTVEVYYLTLLPALLIGAVLLFVSQSNVGRVFHAIGDNEHAVEAAGLDTTKFKLWAFTLSAIPMGIGGALLAHYYGNVAPATTLAVDHSIEMIAMAAIGGMGTILGPFGGAYVFIFLKDSLYRTLFGPSGRWLALWITVLVLLVWASDGVFYRIWTFLGKLGGDER